MSVAPFTSIFSIPSFTASNSQMRQRLTDGPEGQLHRRRLDGAPGVIGLHIQLQVLDVRQPQSQAYLRPGEG